MQKMSLYMLLPLKKLNEGQSPSMEWYWTFYFSYFMDDLECFDLDFTLGIPILSLHSLHAIASSFVMTCHLCSFHALIKSFFQVLSP